MQEDQRDALIEPQEPRPRRRLWVAICIGMFGGLAVLAGLWVLFSASSPIYQQAAPPEFEGTPLPVGRVAPDFTLPTFSGGTLALHTLRGKPVVLNFWASWCAPCVAETPLLMRLRRVYEPRGIVFVGVDVEDDDADARRFAGQYHVDYTLVRSADNKLMNAYAVTGLPTTVFIGADGVVIDKEIGGYMGPEGEKALTTRLDRLLKSAAP